MKDYGHRYLSTKDKNWPDWSSRILYGEGLFTSTRWSNGKILCSALHWERLKKGAHYLWSEIDNQFFKEDFDTQINTDLSRWVFDQNLDKLQEMAIRVDLLLDENKKIRYFFTYRLLTQEEISPSPEKLKMAFGERGDSALPSFIKSPNYMEILYQKREAKKKGHTDVYFISYSGYILEASTSNLFFLFDDKIMTPRLCSGVLDGVARRVLLNLKEINGLKVLEGDIAVDLLAKAKGAWMTNSVRGVIPIEKIDQYKFSLDFASQVRECYLKSCER